MQISSVLPIMAFCIACSINVAHAETSSLAPGDTARNVSGQPACASQPEPFEDQDGAFGFQNAEEEPVIAARFRHATCFFETGIAAVVDGTGWAYIDRQGEVLVRPFVFDNGPDPFINGLARFVSDGRMGFFDIQGRVVIDAIYEWVEPFSSDRAMVCTGCIRTYAGEHWTMTGGVWEAIDRRGQRIDASE